MNCERCDRPKATDKDHLARGDCRGCDECAARCWGGRDCATRGDERRRAAEADLQKARDNAETRRQALRDAINDIDRLHDEADASKAALERAEGRVRALEPGAGRDSPLTADEAMALGVRAHWCNAMRAATTLDEWVDALVRDVDDNVGLSFSGGGIAYFIESAQRLARAAPPPTPSPPLDVEPRPPAEAGDDCADAAHLRLLADGVTGCRRCGRVVRWDVPAKEQAAEQVAARRFCSECGHWVEECECPRAVEDEEQAAGGGEGEGGAES